MGFTGIKYRAYSLETVLKYADYFFMPLFAPFFVKILYRNYGYARKFCLK